MASITYRDITAEYWYDEQVGCPAGWYIRYVRTTPEGHCEVDDSAKIWHPEVPRRRDAFRAVERIARRYARELARV